MIKVLMLPHVSEVQNQSNGISRVIEGYFAHLPEFDIELVKPDATSYDLVAAHAGITGSQCDVAHLHGLYFTADYNASDWEWHVNSRVIEAARNAKIITVPSPWVAETIQRDMRLNPVVIGHGINWREWQDNQENRGYVLWNKNRNFDVCDNSILDILIKRFPDTQFVSTLPTQTNAGFINSPMWPENFRILPAGARTPHDEMKGFVQRCGVYLSVAKETFGIGVLEAMASGKPVLGWNWGGNTQLVQHGINGYLAKPNDVDDLCEGLNYCLKYAKRLGANSKELAKGWTWAKSCELVAGVYRLAMAEEKPTVSVIIPVYNKSKEQLGRAIESCLTQTFKPSQIIVVNDGSQDDYSWVEAMGSQSYYPVKYINQSNSGVAHARNNGISHSSSKYICCLDADDWIQPEFLETCIKALEADRSLGIAYSGLRTHHSDGSSTISQWPNAFNPDKQLTYAQKQNQVPTCCVFRRDAWERVGGYKSRYCPYGAGSEDAALWSAITSIGYNAKQVTVDYSEQIYALEAEILKIKADGGDIGSKIDELRILREQDGKADPLFNYTAHGGNVHGNQEYTEVDWLSMYPWAKDGLHPFASVATPKKWSHPVRQYDQPLVSVIIPVGPRHELEVINALDSLEMQHFRKWEVIVVNDTNEVVNVTLQQNLTAYPYARITSTYGYGRGAGVSRNRGASISRAPLLFFLDADDVLASPDALGMMVQAWNNEQSIIYSDYLGKAVWDYDAAKKAMGDNLLDYNHKSGIAVFRKQSQDFDCELAIKQPLLQVGEAMPYYHWSLVSVLIPKIWHDKIGGFDEAMETWEDVLYHWKLARLGYCYHRIPEPLVLYNYHKGFRREASQVIDNEGRQKHKTLIQYIRSELEQIKPMGCNCGGKRKENPTVTATQLADMPDDTFVMIEFDFPGSETRQTYGKNLLSPSKQTGPDGKVLNYQGYGRSKGDRFLVHIKDQRARPDMFRLVQHEVVLPEVEKVELSEPQLLVPDKPKRGRPAKAVA